MMSIKTLILLNLFASLVVIVAAVPVGKFLTSKNVEWIDDDADDVDGDKNDVLSPVDNLVEPEDYEVTDEAAEAADQKPGNFVTGHRIPLELFSADTLKRIELIPETTSAASAASGPADNRYVNSESFRSGVQGATSAEVEPRSHHFFEDDRETLLGAKIDPNYRRTLIKFLPDY